MGSIINRGTKAEPKWYVKYKDADGRQTMVRARVTSKAKAREFLRSAEQNVDMGRVGVEKMGTEKSFAELAAHWLEAHSATLESHADNVGRMAHLTKALGNLPVSAVTAERVALLRAKMAAETIEDEEGNRTPRWRPSTVNRVLALLRKVLNDGVSWGPSGRRTGSELLVRPAERQVPPRATPAWVLSLPFLPSSRKTGRSARGLRIFARLSVARSELRPCRTRHFY